MLKKVKLFLLTSGFVFRAINWFAYYIRKLHSKNIPSNQNIGGNVKSVALVFNKRHFDPGRPDGGDKELKYAGSVVWARLFYDYFVDSNVNVKLYDIEDEVDIDTNFDLVIGLASRAFLKVSKSNKNAAIILFAVNWHPYLKNRTILDECKRLRVPLCLMEMVNPFIFNNSVGISDRILLLGNETARLSYVVAGVDNAKISLVSGMADSDIFKKVNTGRRSEVNVIYPAGYIGARKGFVRFARGANVLLRSKRFQKLTVIGGFDPNLRSLADQAFHGCESAIDYVGWVSHTDLVRLLSNSDVVVLLSLEEGRVYSVLEAISCGCVPLISKFCGIDLPSEYVVEDPGNEAEIEHKLSNLLNNLDHYKSIHSALLRRLEEDAEAKNYRKVLYEICK